METYDEDLEASEASWADVGLLARRAQEGDREAFGLLVEQFQRTVYGIALRRIGNTSEALELTQEVFLHVLHTIGQLREPERFAGWLRQVATRMAINRATRRVAPTCVEAGVLEGLLPNHEEPVDELITRERAQRLWSGLDRLKQLDRETLVAFYIQGQTLLEIAEQLETPVGTIKRRLHTARKRLKAELEASTIAADEWSDAPPLFEDDEELMETALVAS
jgi:RNA polymerase sigma-70 factor (ECF subfamily)